MPPSYGHIRYVLSEEEISQLPKDSPTSIPDADVLALIMLLGLLLVVLVQFLGVVLSGTKFGKKVESILLLLNDHVPIILRLFVGLFLILSGIAGQLFSPQLGIALGPSSLISILQLISGALLLIGLLTKVGALILVLLVANSFLLLGFHGLDQFVLLGVAILLFFEGGVRSSIDSFTVAKIEALKNIGAFLLRFKPYSMPALRISLGITLLWLGLTEKLLTPELTEAAVVKYGVPYFPELRLFVFFFGFFEILLGMHYLLGIFNRLISLIYLGLLVSALFLFGETTNHLHLFAVAIAFLIRGSGQYSMGIVLRNRADDHLRKTAK